MTHARYCKWSFVPVLTVMACGFSVACSATSDRSDADAVKALYSEYVQEVKGEASLEELAKYWDLSTLREMYDVGDDEQLEMFEYALEYPDFFDDPPSKPVAIEEDHRAQCLLSLGEASDGQGRVAVHILFTKSGDRWRHREVHAEFLSGDPGPSEPDCSFAETLAGE